MKDRGKPVRRALALAAVGIGFAVLCLLGRAFFFGISFLCRFGAAAGLVFALWALCGLPFAAPRTARAARLLRGLIAAGLLVFLILCASFEANIRRYGVTDAEPGADYLLVFGAGVDGTTPSRILAGRIDAALAYLRDNPETVAVLSGNQGSGEDISEAEAMYRALVAAGVSPDRLIREDASGNTAENVRNALAIMKERGWDEHTAVAAVTNDFHLYRARRLLRREGADRVVGIAVPLPELPFFGVNYHLREYFSLAKQMLAEIFAA